jgi:hypothetical protein
MHDQQDLARLVVHIDEDLLDERSDELLLRSRVGCRRVPRRFQIL